MQNFKFILKNQKAVRCIHFGVNSKLISLLPNTVCLKLLITFSQKILDKNIFFSWVNLKFFPTWTLPYRNKRVRKYADIKNLKKGLTFLLLLTLLLTLECVLCTMVDLLTEPVLLASRDDDLFRRSACLMALSQSSRLLSDTFS